jgi:hypothetical protein
VNHHHYNRDYLTGDQILQWFTDKSIHGSLLIHDYATYAYVSAITSIYDKWIRDDSKLKLWKIYLKLGRVNNYWTKEVLQSTKECNNDTNIEFIQSKIDRLKNNISDLIDTINECTIILTVHRKHDSNNQTAQEMFQTAGIHTPGAAFPDNNIRDSILQFSDYVHEHIKHCTRHFRKPIDTKSQLAKAEVNEFEML